MIRLFKIMQKDNDKGFTLVELMIVVAIIGILAAIAIPQFAAYRIRGFNTAALSDVKNLATTEAAFSADWQGYAITAEAATAAAAATAAPIAVAAGTAIPGAVATGGNGVASSDFIVANFGTVIGTNGRSAVLGVSNGVSIVANSSGPFDSFTGIAKHAQGNTAYGVDSDVTMTYQDPSSIPAGTVLTISATNTPPSTIGTDDFNGVASWVVK